MKAVEWLGWKATGARNRLVDRAWELRLNVRTRGDLEVAETDAHAYDTTAYSSIFRILERLELGPDDVLVDVGCGKGRVLCCAARLPVRKVLGVDLDRRLCQAARANVERLRGRRAPVELLHSPAQDVDYAECTAFVLCNPFGPATLERWLDALGRSLRARPRGIRLAYVNPPSERLLFAVPGLSRYDRWDRAPWTGLKRDVSFWRTPAS